MFDVVLFNQLILVAPLGISSFFAPNGADHEAPLAVGSRKNCRWEAKVALIYHPASLKNHRESKRSRSF